MAPTGSRDGQPDRPSHGLLQVQRRDTTAGNRHRRPVASSSSVRALASRPSAYQEEVRRRRQMEQPALRQLNRPRSRRPRSGSQATGSRGSSAGIEEPPNHPATPWSNAPDSRRGRIVGSHQPGPVLAAAPLRSRRRRTAPQPPASRWNERVGSYESGLTIAATDLRRRRTATSTNP